MMFSKSKSLCKAAISARNVSERFHDQYIHVMMKKFHKPILAIGGRGRQRLSNNGWNTFCIYRNGVEVEFTEKIWMGR